ncbi:CRE-AEX-5 protein [Caenorhabditis remanei]|uniref:CRE-AEX-5 protein n=1 Tax=Caenorhabditis remanei TaxID=31234 RepID=E3MFD1_CAERE|nr:CRE-AEX-5 protein [Caenorhabditis remanei]
MKRKVRQIKSEVQVLLKVCLSVFENKSPDWNLLPSMRIREAWEAGFNASRVTVAVVDDGVDVAHVDLRSAFSPDVSFDFVKFGSLPIPAVSKDTQHGTQCAGLVAMEGNQCGLGVGHGATLGAIRLLGQDTLNDALEGDALAFQKNLIDIYSVSWGPKDDGLTAEKPAKFTQEAIRNGAIHGRKGLGNIFVWASGNGGMNGDNCALDGYVSNEYTISFGVVDSTGAPASYAEGCSSVLAAVSGGDSMIQTTGLESKCSVISGSSASAAIASGVIALALEANPTLSQRDIQHLIVHTANPSAIRDITFFENAAGLKFHPSVGFGLLDAQKLVERAATWQNVGEQKVCRKTKLLSGDIDVTDCVGVTRTERVILTGSVIHPHRGQVRMHIESPHGTVSELLPLRSKDESSDLLEWDFVSVHFFGESPKGVWKLRVISEEDLKDPESFRVKLTEFKITGT